MPKKKDGNPNKRIKKENGKETPSYKSKKKLRPPLECLLLPHETIQNMQTVEATVGTLTTPQLLDAVCAAVSKDHVGDVRPVSHVSPQLRYCLSRCHSDTFGFMDRQAHQPVAVQRMKPPFMLHEEVFDMERNMVVPNYRLHFAASRPLHFLGGDPNVLGVDDSDDDASMVLSTEDEDFDDDVNELLLEGSDEEEEEEEDVEEVDDTDVESDDDFSTDGSDDSYTSEDEEDDLLLLDDQNPSEWGQDVPLEDFNTIKGYVKQYSPSQVTAVATHSFVIDAVSATYPVFATYSIRCNHTTNDAEDRCSGSAWTLTLVADAIHHAGDGIPEDATPNLRRSSCLGIRNWEHDVVLDKMLVPPGLELIWAHRIRNRRANFHAECPQCTPKGLFMNAQFTSLTLSDFWKPLKVIGWYFCRDTPNMKTLNLCSCQNVSIIEMLADVTPALHTVDLRGMSKLREIVDSFSCAGVIKKLFLPPSVTRVSSGGFPVCAAECLGRLQALTSFTGCNAVSTDESLHLQVGPAPVLKYLGPSFEYLENLVTLDISWCTEQLETIFTLACNCSNLETVIVGNLPQLTEIDTYSKDLRHSSADDNGFLTNCPSLTELQMNPAPKLQEISGRAFMKTPKLSFDLLQFVTRPQRPRIQIISIDCTPKDKDMIPFLEGSRLAQTVDWLALIRAASCSSMAFLLYSWIHRFESGEPMLNRPTNVLGILRSVLGYLQERLLEIESGSQSMAGDTTEERLVDAAHVCFMAAVLNGAASTYRIKKADRDHIRSCFHRAHVAMRRLCPADELLDNMSASIGFAIWNEVEDDGDVSALHLNSLIELLQWEATVISVDDPTALRGVQLAEYCCHVCQVDDEDDNDAGTRSVRCNELQSSLFPAGMNSNSVFDSLYAVEQANRPLNVVVNSLMSVVLDIHHLMM